MSGVNNKKATSAPKTHDHVSDKPSAASKKNVSNKPSAAGKKDVSDKSEVVSKKDVGDKTCVVCLEDEIETRALQACHHGK